MAAEQLLDNWEDLDEAELDTTVKKLEEETVKAKQEENFAGALLSSVQSNSMEKPVIILKRPESQQREVNLQNVRPKTQMKPLHQRQQEYAEARMRILGSMPPDDGDFSLRTSPLVVPPNQMRPNPMVMNGTVGNPGSNASSTTNSIVTPNAAVSRGEFIFRR